MACLQVQVTAHSLAIVPISVSLNNTYLECNVKRVGGIEAYATRSDTPVVLHVVDVASHLKLSCGIVCGLKDSHIKFVTRGTQFVDKNGFVILVKRG